MRILILNWRDIKNPEAGGAEILTHKLAGKLVSSGNTVTQISSFFRGGKRQERVNGVEIIRVGNPDARRLFSAVYFKAYVLYRKKFRNKVDLVVDEIHGVPFFSPLYVREKKVALICEVANDLWDISVKFPFNKFGRILEGIYPFFYKDVEVITISESSKEDLMNLGIKREKISLLPLGCDIPLVEKLPKKRSRTKLIFLARLVKSKGVEFAIDAVKILQEEFPDIRLDIVGRGDKSYILSLKKKVKNLDLTSNVSFLGRVTEREKIKMLTDAYVLVVPSSKEGWGLTIHEAGARGTPAVVFNTGGLRDVVKNNVNGIICKENTSGSIAESVRTLMKDERLYRRLQEGALSERKKHTWDATVNSFMKIINR